jgi:hypothetical protein
MKLRILATALLLALGGTLHAADEPPIPHVQAFAEQADTLRALLVATPEQWSVIAPKLAHIASLRDEIHATIAMPYSEPPRNAMFDTPKGGTSMDAPVVNNRPRNSGGLTDLLGLNPGPFNPADAPGKSSGAGLGAAIRTRVGRAVTERFKTGRGNQVRKLMGEMQTLLTDSSVTDEQVREKLASIRAARTSARHDLAAAQTDLFLMLTTDQIALLVAHGYAE